MNTTALALMIGSQAFIAGITLYFFYKALTTKKKEEPDSYSEN